MNHLDDSNYQYLELNDSKLLQKSRNAGTNNASLKELGQKLSNKKKMSTLMIVLIAIIVLVVVIAIILLVLLSLTWSNNNNKEDKVETVTNSSSLQPIIDTKSDQ